MSVRRDGHDLPLGPPRRRALLALLLIRLGRVVSTESLIEELWGGAPPRQAVATLQSHVSHLRRALQPAAGPEPRALLRHRAPGYVLEVDPEQVDVFRFERLVADGRRLLDRPDAPAARDRLAEALTLWRGSPYAEFDGHPLLSDEGTRLDQLRLTAVEAFAEARLALGAAEEVAAELDREARRHPARERLVGHLMTALSRLGRQAEALEVYERTRAHLAQEFGVDAAAELRRIRTAILRQEPEGRGPVPNPRPAPFGPAERLAVANAPGPVPATNHRDDTVPGADGHTPARTTHGLGRPAEADRSDYARAPRHDTDSPETADAAEAPGRGGARASAAGTDPFDGGDGTAAAEVPSASGRPAARSPFTGRSQELHRLTTVAAGALAGQAHVAGVLGPAGVGKSRLLLELAARLEAADGGDGSDALEVVWGHCFLGEGVPPYWLWTQILRRLSATRPVEFRNATQPFGALLAPLMPEWSSDPRGTAASSAADWVQARFLTHDAVCEALLTLAAQRPLVLLLEDLHWADTASLDLLRLLSTRRQGHALGIVLTAREFEVDSDATLRRMLSAVLRGPSTETLRLGGLSRQDVADLVGAQAGPGVDAKVVEVLHRRSEGNPYFVTQLLSLLGDARDLHRPDAADVLLARIPTGVREVLHQRFAALPEPVLTVLRLCAVIGAEIETDLLHRVAPDDAPVASALETALLAGLLDEDPHHSGRLHFTHALVQETLVAELARVDRQRLHARVAEALCARRRGQVGEEEIERVAHHTWHAKSALPAVQGLPRLLRAAEHAEQSLAYEQVETWLRRAMHLVGFLPPDDPEAARLEQRLHIQLGQVLATTRGYGHPEAETALARGRALSAVTDAPEDPSVLWALSAACLVSGRYDASREFSGLLRTIAERTGEPVAVLGAAYGDGIVLHVRGLLPQALDALEHAVTMADRFAHEGHSLGRTFQHDPRVSCRSYDTFTHWLLGDQQTARVRRRELLRLTAYESRPSDRSFALYVNAVVAAWEGDAHTARSNGAEGSRLAGEHGLLYWKSMLALLEGWGLTHLGREVDGLALMHTSLSELHRTGTRLRRPLHLGLLAQAQHHAGHTEEAQATFRALLAAAEQRREHVYVHPALPATQLLHDLLGSDATDAVRAVQRLASGDGVADRFG
ncbi:BTAD domain-containing putative transcriptional regulator [Streptomyces sp. DB-54]